jgi:predicted RNA binding protein YcfA (HicA-like mRNA interferase family)
MPRLGVFSGSEVRTILEQNGFQFVRQKGSHMIMQRTTTSGTMTVPIPDHREIRLGTLQSIIRQSGLPRDLFLK